jgi:hypothetical protein
MTTDPATIARTLPSVLRLALLDGCCCDHADEMVQLGLWKPKFSEPSQYYITTPLGHDVRDYLRSQDNE